MSEKTRSRQLVLTANTEDQKRDAALYIARRCEDSAEISAALGLLPA